MSCERGIFVRPIRDQTHLSTPIISSSLLSFRSGSKPFCSGAESGVCDSEFFFLNFSISSTNVAVIFSSLPSHRCHNRKRASLSQSSQCFAFFSENFISINSNFCRLLKTILHQAPPYNPPPIRDTKNSYRGGPVCTLKDNSGVGTFSSVL